LFSFFFKKSPPPGKLDRFLGICVRNKEGEIECVRKPSKEEKELWRRRGRWFSKNGKTTSPQLPSTSGLFLKSHATTRPPARSTSSGTSFHLYTSAPITIPVTFAPTFYLGRPFPLFSKEEGKWN